MLQRSACGATAHVGQLVGTQIPGSRQVRGLHKGIPGSRQLRGLHRGCSYTHIPVVSPMASLLAAWFNTTVHAHETFLFLAISHGCTINRGLARDSTGTDCPLDGLLLIPWVRRRTHTHTVLSSPGSLSGFSFFISGGYLHFWVSKKTGPACWRSNTR